MQIETIGGCTVILGDALSEIPRLGCFDCAIFSPPYNMGKDLHTFKNGVRKSQNYVGFSDNMPEADYQENQVKVLSELYKCVAGPVFYSHKDRIRGGDTISPFQWLTKTDWLVSQCVVLNKKSGANVDKRRFFPVHEWLYVLQKVGANGISNEECLTSVWGVEQTSRKVVGHPATMPPSVADKCLRASMPNRVLDPYAGSGTTLLAAQRAGIEAVGVELSEQYFQLICERLTKQIESDLEQPRFFA